jgi:hypothetical protein
MLTSPLILLLENEEMEILASILQKKILREVTLILLATIIHGVSMEQTQLLVKLYQTLLDADSTRTARTGAP